MPDREVLSAPMTVAVIGLGNMGLPMSACLLKAGYQVLGYDLNPESREKLAAVGGDAIETLAEAAAAGAIITLLPDGKIARTVIDALRPDLKPGTAIIEMSSSDPIGTQELGEQLINAGMVFIDAPVSGGVKRATDGTLTIMVGGDDASIDVAMPILNAMGKTIFRTGLLGSGHAMKALNNYVSAAGLVAAVEAIEIGRAFGLDPETMTDILNVSTGRNNTTEVKLKPFIVSEKYSAGFPLRLMAKDVRTADQLARAINVPTPFANYCSSLWDAAAETLPADTDHTAIGLHIRTLAPAE